MKQISDKITLIPLGNIRAQYKQSISIKDESENYTYTSSSPVKYTQSCSESESGLKYEIIHTSVCNSSDILRYNNKNIVAKMVLMDRSYVYIGTLDIPSKVLITPFEKNLYKVEIKVSLPYPLDF